MSPDVSPREQPTATGASGAEEEFRRRVAEVEVAAREWGLRWHEPEGRFNSAILSAIGMLGELGRGSHGVMESIARASREAAAADLRRAQALREAGQCTPKFRPG